MMLNTSTIKNIITLHNTDKETLDIIQECLHSFEQYHSAIYEMETKIRIYSYESMDADEYKTMVEDMDRRRTRTHNLKTEDNLSPTRRTKCSPRFIYY